MTTEEKLQHFLAFCIEDSRTRSEHMLDEYTDALEKSFKEHEADANRRAEKHIETEKERFEREVNKKLSLEQISLKRVLSQKQEELKDKVFTELRNMLATYMETSAYEQLLNDQIKAAIDFAGKEELIIYIDPADESKLRRLAMNFHADIRVSQYSFSGGTRAVIPSKNILIDNSFEKKLEEARAGFHFELGGGANV